jgi:hypothetical protein
MPDQPKMGGFIVYADLMSLQKFPNGSANFGQPGWLNRALSMLHNGMRMAGIEAYTHLTALFGDRILAFIAIMAWNFHCYGWTDGDCPEQVVLSKGISQTLCF